MLVTKIEAVTKTKHKVFLDEQFAFVLYKGELSRYHIKEEAEVTPEVYAKIREEVVLKRAKLRVMHLLQDMDRSEEQLRLKLKQSLYTEDIIEAALQYVKSFGYIDDSNYARRFVESRKKTKSKKEIYAALCQKGIDKYTIQEALELCYKDVDEKDAIQKLIEKKHVEIDNMSDKEKKKICEYLMRKGFRYDDICRVIQVIQ